MSVSDYVDSFPVCILPRDFLLYHVCYRKCPLVDIVLEQEAPSKFEEMKDLQIGEIFHYKGPKYFGLTPEFPYFYGGDIKYRPTVKCKTLTELRLVDIGYTKLGTDMYWIWDVLTKQLLS